MDYNCIADRAVITRETNQNAENAALLSAGLAEAHGRVRRQALDIAINWGITTTTNVSSRTTTPRGWFETGNVGFAAFR